MRRKFLFALLAMLFIVAGASAAAAGDTSEGQGDPIVLKPKPRPNRGGKMPGMPVTGSYDGTTLILHVLNENGTYTLTVGTEPSAVTVCGLTHDALAQGVTVAIPAGADITLASVDGAEYTGIYSKTEAI